MKISENFSDKSVDGGKIIDFSQGKNFYGKLIDKHANDGDYLGALSFAFAALKDDYSAKNLASIAEIYSDMGLLDLSNEYWFRYLHVAEESKYGIAYEELAINNFECKSYGLAAYYIQKKISADGNFDNQELCEEIYRSISATIEKRDLYKVVYPTGCADYSAELSFAKLTAAMGDYHDVIVALKDIPEDSPFYREAAEKLSSAYYAENELEKAIEIKQKLIEKFGGTATLYCELSAIYSGLKNDDKAKYYYLKAKELPKTDDEETIGFAMCAGVQGDFLTAAENLKTLVDGDFYDDKLLTYYGIALVNSGDYVTAGKMFKRAYAINPVDTDYAFYVSIAEQAENGKNIDEYLPLPFDGSLPKAEVSKREKFLGTQGVKNGKIVFKDKEKFYEYYRWGVFDQGDIFRKCLIIASFYQDKRIIEILKDALFSDDVSISRKQAIIFTLLCVGYKKPVSVASGGMYVKFKPHRLPSQNDENEFFFTSYAFALSKMAFSGENLDKIAFASNNIYKKLKDSELIKLISYEELAAATVLECGFKSVKNDGDIFSVFGVKKERMKGLLDILRGNNNGKNN